MKRSLFYRIRELRYLLSTLRFNFHYFGWKGCFIRPIVFYGPVKLRDMKGSILFNCPLKHSLVSIGLPGNEMFLYDTPTIWSDQGGKIIFNGSFGTNPGASFIIRKDATLHIGSHCSFGQNLRLLCSNSIVIGDELLASWDITIMDTDSHFFKDLTRNELGGGSKPIEIGKHCFLGSSCCILKGSFLPNGSVVASHALVAKEMDEENSLYRGIPAKLIKTGIRYEY